MSLGTFRLTNYPQPADIIFSSFGKAASLAQRLGFAAAPEHPKPGLNTSPGIEKNVTTAFLH
eukprot:861140-Prorocentrum_minimum.AAC.3